MRSIAINSEVGQARTRPTTYATDENIVQNPSVWGWTKCIAQYSEEKTCRSARVEHHAHGYRLTTSMLEGQTSLLTCVASLRQCCQRTWGMAVCISFNALTCHCTLKQSKAGYRCALLRMLRFSGAHENILGMVLKAQNDAGVWHDTKDSTENCIETNCLIFPTALGRSVQS